MRFEKNIKRVNQYFYDQTHLIAKGNRANVYRGTNSVTGEQVAIKMIDFSQNKTLITPQHIINETRVLKSSVHPNLIYAQHALQTPNHFYLFMPLYGPSLYDILKERKKLSEL